MLVCGLGISHPASALSVEDVRFGKHEDKVRLVLELSEITDFRVFALPDPYRLVIDLPSFTWNASPVPKPAGLSVKSVRHGKLQEGISRIVIDIDKPPEIKTAFLLPHAVGRADRLVIDYASVSPATFNAHKGKIHGTLDTKQAAITQRAIDQGETRTAGMATPSRKPDKAPPKKKPLIIIDPGHGGQDPGAINGRTREKDIVLALSKELRNQLEATGRYRVKLTRESDVFIRLTDRVKFARHHGADLFVSIHADSIEKPNVQGASIYTLSEKASDSQTAKLAARENRADLIAGIDLSTEDEEVANILVDLAMRDTTNQAKFFANSIVGQLKSSGVRTLDTPHRHAGFAVLKAPDIPSVLIEAGFISNRSEARLLSDPSYRAKIARALKTGIETYFERVALHERS